MSLLLNVRKRVSAEFTLDVNVTAAPGITMVFGASGSGKTTLLRAVAGLAEPDSGRIATGDRVLFDASTGINVPVSERRIGYVFQQLALFPHMSAERNIGYGIAHVPERERRERIGRIADAFHITHTLTRSPSAISGGERQRVALARALVVEPSLLLLDEPLSALDHRVQSSIIADLRGWNESHGIPVLYVTHSHREVHALGERVIALDNGRIVADGTPGDVMDNPALEPIAQLAGFENFFDAVVTTLAPGAGTMSCRLVPDGPDLEVPHGNATAGQAVRIAIRAGDILLATERPVGLSARNILDGRLTSLTRNGPTVAAVVDAGAPFAVHLTPGAVDHLKLATDQNVWLIVKTHSCRLVAPRTRPSGTSEV